MDKKHGKEVVAAMEKSQEMLIAEKIVACNEADGKALLKTALEKGLDLDNLVNCIDKVRAAMIAAKHEEIAKAMKLKAIEERLYGIRYDAVDFVRDSQIDGTKLIRTIIDVEKLSDASVIAARTETVCNQLQKDVGKPLTFGRKGFGYIKERVTFLTRPNNPFMGSDYGSTYRPAMQAKYGHK